MGAGGTMIRLIDVVFILLFGFISISDVTEKTRIELPESTETPASSPDREQVCFVGIDGEGRFLVENESVVIRSAQGLLGYLQNKMAELDRQGEALRVRIRSNWDTPIKYTMAAADICDHLGIAKGIDVRRVE